MLADTPSPTTSRSGWSIPSGVTYLNHGSFGPSPRVVQEVREEWSRRLNANPMEFFLRTMEPALDEAAARLGQFIGADARDLVFVENATVAMNVVAESLPLAPGDEILLNDHEYGAVFRIWRSVCERTGAKIVSPTLGRGEVTQSAKNEERRTPHPSPLPAEPGRGDKAEELRRFTDAVADIIEPILAAITPRTKLIVISHVTSPTGIVFPVAEISRAARARGIPVCIDGPHAIAMCEVDLRKIDCDFYCASLHKWLSAPFGSGFLFVRRKWQSALKPHLVSWGRSLGGRPARWQDDLNWLGTRDPAPFLAVPAAIEFLERVGLATFRQQTHDLAQYARTQLEQTLGQVATIPDSIDWYGSMIAVPLVENRKQEAGNGSQESGKKTKKKSPPNAIHPWQQQLAERHRIEILVTECHGQKYLRVSCHLYNTQADIDTLMAALKTLV
ncbi:MAG: aminotransferase class V-fold PLP-dependent enzyme [Planctomycetales bacterium]|nr:aminotransferase class V-fold PLP-dependent enzyme [Planctomycetales bacterium]